MLVLFQKLVDWRISSLVGHVSCSLARSAAMVCALGRTILLHPGANQHTTSRYIIIYMYNEEFASAKRSVVAPWYQYVCRARLRRTAVESRRMILTVSSVSLQHQDHNCCWRRMQCCSSVVEEEACMYVCMYAIIMCYSVGVSAHHHPG